VNLDGKVRAEQLALHALNAILRSRSRDQEDIHLQDILRAELDTDAAALAVLLDDFDSGAHSVWSPLSVVFRLQLANFAAKDSMIVVSVPVIIPAREGFFNKFIETKKYRGIRAVFTV
jgi:hypothetical protein